MRIVHDIDGPATVSGGGRPYALALKQKIATSFQADVLILVTPSHPIVSEEEINIEGDARHILKALRDAVNALEATAQVMIEEGTLAPGWDAPEPEPTYACSKCGAPRTKAEGGTTFTVCDTCWDEAHPKEGRP